mmetsp:Transcript_13679/g.27202  ORF Transcript_13679/g.27202 Transcript_13679/m.27202 type:complete len:215 (-) Transcript_13679:2491-3135(-)
MPCSPFLSLCHMRTCPVTAHPSIHPSIQTLTLSPYGTEADRQTGQTSTCFFRLPAACLPARVLLALCRFFFPNACVQKTKERPCKRQQRKKSGQKGSKEGSMHGKMTFLTQRNPNIIHLTQLLKGPLDLYLPPSLPFPPAVCCSPPRLLDLLLLFCAVAGGKEEKRKKNPQSVRLLHSIHSFGDMGEVTDDCRAIDHCFFLSSLPPFQLLPFFF